MSASLAPVFVFRAFDANGAPLVGGKLYSYAAGTSTPLATYTDQGGATPAANPIVLDANGQCSLWLGAASYKFNLTDASGSQQPNYPKDNIVSGKGDTLAAMAQFSNTADVAQGDALIGVKPSIAQVGVTQHVINGAIVIPEMFGAVAGTGVIDSVRTANTVALNAAWFAVRAVNGTLDISDTYETNGPVILGSATTPFTQPAMIACLRRPGSILGFGTTGAVLDGSACRFLRIRDLYVYSTSAECGLIAGRTNISGDAQSWILENVTIRGSYTKAPLITIAAEDFRAINCQFWNNKAGGYTYMSSPFPDQIAPTTTYTLMPASGGIVIPTNTDIRFIGCVFYNSPSLAGLSGASYNGVWLDTAFAGGFTDCTFVGDPTTTGNVGYGFTIVTSTVAGYVNSFLGKLVIDHNHFELQTLTGTSFLMNFSNPTGGSCTFGSIDLINNFNAKVGPSAGWLAWTNIGWANLTQSTIMNNGVLAFGIAPVMQLPYMTKCVIRSEFSPVQLYGSANITYQFAAQSCEIVANGITWGSGMVAGDCVITDLSAHTTTYGSGPIPAQGTNVQAYSSGANVRRFILGPQSYSNAPYLRGELQTHDPAYFTIPTIDPNHGDVITHFNGMVLKPLGVNYGTPLHSYSSGIEGQLVYNNTYLYVCMASGTTGTALGAMTGAITIGTKDLTVTGGTIANLNTGNANGTPYGSFISVVGLAGPQMITNVVGNVITLAVAASATITAGSVAWAVPAWYRTALTTTW